MNTQRQLALLSASLALTALTAIAGICSQTTVTRRHEATGTASVDLVQANTSPPATRTIGSGLLRTADMVDTEHGWALTSRGLMWTDDAGATWNAITPPAIEPDAVAGALFLDPLRGWLVARTSDTAGSATLAILSTRDGGKSWLPYDLGTTDLLLPSGRSASISFSDLEHGWVMVRRASSANFSLGDLFRTTDGGKTWMLLPPPPIGDPIVFVSPARGWVAGGRSGDQLFMTRDGGETWIPQSVDAGQAQARLSITCRVRWPQAS